MYDEIGKGLATLLENIELILYQPTFQG